MFNPRFPHTLRVLRSNGTDEEGNPLFVQIPLDVVVMRGGLPVTQADGSFLTEIADTLPFGYRTQGRNTKDTTDVEVADYKLSTPMFLTPLKSTDVVEMTDYDRTYRCDVVKKATFNLGSNIWVNEIKN